MSAFADIRKQRPVRYMVALVVFRALWWPVMAIAIPFAVIGSVVDWLSWSGFPAIARSVQPVFAGARRGALAVGNFILGYQEPRP